MIFFLKENWRDSRPYSTSIKEKELQVQVSTKIGLISS
jgi:hypothetical protein